MDKATEIWKKADSKQIINLEKKACLTIIKGSSLGEIYNLADKNILGSSQEANIVLTDIGISRQHLLIQKENTNFIANDLRSTNGTEINDKEIFDSYRLVDGDKIRIADTVLKFSFYDTEEANYQKHVRSLIVTDDLTKIYNKRYFSETIKKEFDYAQRNKSHLCLIMLDIDHFKKINDQYGHQAGDFMLTKIAELIVPLTRSYDIFARFGGEEFALLLRETDLTEAVILANRIKQTIANFTFNYQGQNIQATISLGISTYSTLNNIKDHHQLICIADHYLYKAKHAGRNKVCYEKV